MPHTLVSKLQAFEGSMAVSKTDVPLSLKVRTAELILRVMQRREEFGMFVILGWRTKWQKFTDIADSDQDIFARHHVDIREITPNNRPAQDMAATVNFDGAILIDRRGIVTHSGVVIEGMRPSVVAKKVHPGKFKDLSEQFGFETKVHTRHLAAISASYVFKGTTVFTVSEETDAFHVFEGGRIMFNCK